MDQFGFCKSEITQLCENEGVTDIGHFYLGVDTVAHPASVLACIKELKLRGTSDPVLFKP